ncbi:MAG TPA: C4-dicarboxylate ABC transporter [Burkholderiales bacterium]|nr:C4-dicarboxylate ABC transporter [Burkholderiales bacterium]
MKRPRRRRFLAASAAALGFPAIGRAQDPVTLRLQSTWAAKDIFHEYALDFAARVNDMAGGELRIEVLPAGAVAQAFGVLDAVSQGLVDAGHGTLSHHYGRHPAFALWGSGPAFAMDANLLLAWHKYGGGAALLERLYAAIGANVVSLLYGPMPTQPLGWFRKPINRPQDFRGLRFRAAGVSSELFAGLGATVNALPASDVAAAMERALIDGAELNNASSDRALGLAAVARVYMLQSYHRNAEQFELLFNRARFDALPPRLRALVANAAEAASADMSWKAIDRYSRDYRELYARDKVRSYKTPDAVLQRELESHDAAARNHRQDPLYREIEGSQREFAERAVRWLLDTQVGPQLAYRHYFGAKPAARPAPAKKPG